LILVSGATGKVGGELVRALSAAGAAVRAVARDPATATPLIGPGVEIVRGDYEHPESLDEAMRGVEKAFLVPPASMRQVKQESNFIDAAKRAGIGHVVKLSLLTADPKSPGPFPQWHGMAERRLEGSGVRFTHLRPNFYMQNLFWFARAIRDVDMFSLPLRDARAALVDLRDVAAAAAAVLLGEGHEGRTYVLTGPQALNFYEVGKLLSEITGRPIGYKPITPEEFKATILKHWNMIEPLADATVSIWRGMSSGSYAGVSPDLGTLLGRPPRSLADFLRDHLALFLPGATKAAPRARKRQIA
jgi:uncharacterized protein YbjT (DUF2867 family)